MLESVWRVLLFAWWLLKTQERTSFIVVLRFQGLGPGPKLGTQGFSDLGGPGVHFRDFGSSPKPSAKVSPGGYPPGDIPWGISPRFLFGGNSFFLFSAKGFYIFLTADSDSWSRGRLFVNCFQPLVGWLIA